MENKNRVVALPKLLIDEFLWATDSTDCHFPAHRIEYDTDRFSKHVIERFERVTEAFPLLIESARRGNENPVFGE
jgi:hypothetical protein